MQKQVDRNTRTIQMLADICGGTVPPSDDENDTHFAEEPTASVAGADITAIMETISEMSPSAFMPIKGESFLQLLEGNTDDFPLHNLELE